MGILCGSLSAAAFMILVPEALRFVGLPGGIAANVRQMLYGAALVGVIWWQHTNRQEAVTRGSSLARQ
jgi:branched-chain amino acid transport system permease protein